MVREPSHSRTKLKHCRSAEIDFLKLGCDVNFSIRRLTKVQPACSSEQKLRTYSAHSHSTNRMLAVYPSAIY